MLERAAHNHGGAAINIHYIAARIDEHFVYLDEHHNDAIFDEHHDFCIDDHLAPIQRALDDLVRCALDFGTTGSNHLWTCGIDDYDVTNLSHNDKARATAALNAALDFAKAVGAARHQVRQP